MKKGQLTAIIVIVLLVAAVGAFMIFSQKRAGRAMQYQSSYGNLPTSGETNCAYDCIPGDGTMLIILVKGTAPPCTAPPKEPVSCGVTLTGFPGWEELKSKCCEPRPGETTLPPVPCVESTVWTCVKAVPKLVETTTVTPAGCKPVPLPKNYPCAEALKVKATAPADSTIHKAYDDCCKEIPPPYCAESTSLTECAYREKSKCCDETGGCILPPGTDPFVRWQSEKGEGTDWPCPYYRPCAKAIPCTCADMIAKYGSCSSPTLLYAAPSDLDAYYTKMLCCPSGAGLGSMTK